MRATAGSVTTPGKLCVMALSGCSCFETNAAISLLVAEWSGGSKLGRLSKSGVLCYTLPNQGDLSSFECRTRRTSSSSSADLITQHRLATVHAS